MRYSPRLRGRSNFGKHPENGPPPKSISDSAAYAHEVDRLASGLLLQQRSLAAICQRVLCLRSLSRSMVDRLIDHDDGAGRDDGFCATVLAFGRVDDSVIAEWRSGLQRAVAGGVGDSSMADASRLLARMVLARDIEHQAIEFAELRKALQLDEPS